MADGTMLALLDEGDIYRVSGEPAFPTTSQPSVSEAVFPRQVTLRDRVTLATLLPVGSADNVPSRLLAYLAEQLNREIEKGDTYPMDTPLSDAAFRAYWFQDFAAIMVMGEVDSIEDLHSMNDQGTDWSKVCLGSFHVKPNYPGRSRHICNGGFLVTEAARNKGAGRLMGEVYLEWAPQLGYTYSVFNLVYETNVVSCRIWDALGFKRIGRIKGAGNLNSHPSEPIDAIIYGRDLGPEGEDFVSEERFDKIRYYLKHSKYPAGADRAEKSRLRSAATHYKLVPNSDGSEERLMLKDKEVVSDPQRQYEIARQVHVQTHGGINKTTASIAERYHWVRIKETVSLVIRNCPDCKESNKSSNVKPETAVATTNGGTNTGNGNHHRKPAAGSAGIPPHNPNREIERLVNFDAAAGVPPGPPGLSGRMANDHASNGVRRNRKPPPLQADIDMQNSSQTSQQQTPHPPSQSDLNHSNHNHNHEPHTPQYHTSQGTTAHTSPQQQQQQQQQQHSQHASSLQSPFGHTHNHTHTHAQHQHSHQHQHHPQIPQQQSPSQQSSQQSQQTPGGMQPPPPPPQAQAPQMHNIRDPMSYEDLPLDPQIISFASHSLAASPLSHHHHSLEHSLTDHQLAEHPLAGHPGLPTQNHQMDTGQTGLPPSMTHHHGLSDHTLSDHALGEHALSNHTLNEHALGEHALNDHALAGHAMGDPGLDPRAHAHVQAVVDQQHAMSMGMTGLPPGLHSHAHSHGHGVPSPFEMATMQPHAPHHTLQQAQAQAHAHSHQHQHQHSHHQHQHQQVYPGQVISDEDHMVEDEPDGVGVGVDIGVDVGMGVAGNAPDDAALGQSLMDAGFGSADGSGGNGHAGHAGRNWDDGGGIVSKEQE